MTEVAAVILAAGMGTRMDSKHPKAVHKICGKAMINWVIDSCRDAGISRIAVVVGSSREEVEKAAGGDVDYYEQIGQHGTGHAVMAAAVYIWEAGGAVLILPVDMPLILPDTISGLIRHHIENGSDATVLTSIAEDPYGYGRIIRDKDGAVMGIKEQKDLDPGEKDISEINTGAIAYRSGMLIDALDRIDDNNAQKEFYLTDTIYQIRMMGGKTGAVVTNAEEEVLGINDRIVLARAYAVMRKRILREHMSKGVTIEDPETVHIDSGVIIGRDVTILPDCRIEGKTVIGEDSVIGPDTDLKDIRAGERTRIVRSVADGSEIGDDVRIGPFSNIRPGSVIQDDVKIGDFVEIKKSIIGKGTKISHHAYVGDAFVGKHCNIGCGVIFGNYDGTNKNVTKVGDNVFIGCNVNLVAPLELADNSYIAAGSTITKNVPEKALSIARCRQTNIENWVRRKNMLGK